MSRRCGVGTKEVLAQGSLCTEVVLADLRSYMDVDALQPLVCRVQLNQPLSRLRACLCACMAACVRGCVRAWLLACVRACVRACVAACVRGCVRACVCACVCACVRASGTRGRPNFEPLAAVETEAIDPAMATLLRANNSVPILLSASTA